MHVGLLISIIMCDCWLRITSHVADSSRSQRSSVPMPEAKDTLGNCLQLIAGEYVTLNIYRLLNLTVLSVPQGVTHFTISVLGDGNQHKKSNMFDFVPASPRSIKTASLECHTRGGSLLGPP